MKRMRLIGVASVAGVAVATLAAYGAQARAGSSAGYKLDCGDPRLLCTEIGNPQEAFGNNYYVGHDEPSLEF